MNLKKFRRSKFRGRRIHNNRVARGYVTEAVDGTVPIESMRLYTQADYDAAIEYGRSQPPDYQAVYKVGFEHGKQERPPSPTWEQERELTRAKKAAWTEGWNAHAEVWGCGEEE